ncbi:unnamed protein product [Rotaria socialis]|nr:unnamed protein product [Rotaria socialis]
MRMPGNFARDSSTAAQLKSNEKGHLGVSIFSEILDIKLPYSTIIDYAHASLLRHSKSMFVEIYRRLSPVIRATIDIALSQQPFPHFFHRRMKSFKDLSFIKATEIRNILFYGFLPIFHQHLQHDYLGHFALYICAMRLFHGRAILGPRTSDIANDLIMKYYQDFSSFYDGLENFVLHLHSHYERQYRMYGTFSHLGSFGQESLIGYIGSNRTGTTHHGDNICENYGIDLMLHHQIENLYSYTNIVDGPFDPDLNFDFKSNDSIIDFYNAECNCKSITCCLRAFRRYAVKQRIYHSLIYKHRQKSVSYFVRYCSKNNSTSCLFGKILMFFKFSNSNSTYALIEQYSAQGLFSDLFISTTYYELLSKAIDHLFYVVSKKCSLCHDVVIVSQLSEHCIVFDCEEYHIITPVSSYDEHD